MELLLLKVPSELVLWTKEKSLTMTEEISALWS